MMPDDLREMVKRLEAIKAQCAMTDSKTWATDPATARVWTTLHAGIFETLKMVMK